MLTLFIGGELNGTVDNLPPVKMYGKVVGDRYIKDYRDRFGEYQILILETLHKEHPIVQLDLFGEKYNVVAG